MGPCQAKQKEFEQLKQDVPQLKAAVNKLNTTTTVNFNIIKN
jgi:hypothetical protein